MARSRNIKPGFFTNDELAECSPFARLLFAGLWTIADKEGRMDDRPKKIKALVLPFDEVDCDELLSQLLGRGFITRYSVNNCDYIQVNNWKKHQNPHCKESASCIPGQCNEDTKSGKEQCKYGASKSNEPVDNNLNPADSLNLIPDSYNTPISPTGDCDSGQTRKRKPSVDYQSIMVGYNKASNGRLPGAEKVTTKRKRAIDKLLSELKEPTVECAVNYFDAFFANARPFYFGDNDRQWKADFDYVLRVETMIKTKEGSL